jgi:phospholipid/cholesterol/gamma-HCH transport system ATP-binding protein
MAEEAIISVKNLDMGYGSLLVMRDLTFTVNEGDIFIVMGGSGCGKSTLLRILIGLKEPSKGQVLYNNVSFWEADSEGRQRIMKRFGILYQSGALWSSMTLAENIILPLEQYTRLSSRQMREIASLKLSLVG